MPKFIPVLCTDRVCDAGLTPEGIQAPQSLRSLRALGQALCGLVTLCSHSHAEVTD